MWVARLGQASHDAATACINVAPSSLCRGGGACSCAQRMGRSDAQPAAATTQCAHAKPSSSLTGTNACLNGCRMASWAWRLLPLAALLAAALVTQGAAAAKPSCLVGDPCGKLGCTSASGSCVRGRCVGIFGDPETCEPFSNACGGSFCEPNKEMCDEASGKCYEQSCANAHAYECSEDKSPLHRVACHPKTSAGVTCYKSESGLFSCAEGRGVFSSSCNAGGGVSSSQIVQGRPQHKRNQQRVRHHDYL